MKNISQLISEQLLPRVSQPGQYVGQEINARCGDVAAAEVSIALAFPDAYNIGISHYGGQMLYHMLNDIDGVACDRTYCPRHDAEQVMRDQSIPLFGWESRLPLSQFDVVGFSLAYELCVTNVLTMLDLAGIALRSKDRTEKDPLIIAGDAMADSPEPMADFIDLFVVGDGEEPLAQLVELIRRANREGLTREQLLLEAARSIPSVYVPRFYRPTGEATGTVEPTRDDVPARIARACMRDLSRCPEMTRQLVPFSQGVHERVVIEIMRGCPNACRFCQAGAARLPVRHRSADEIVRIAREAIAATGFREISLLSLSTSDYPRLDELIERLNAEFEGMRVSISLPSLRADSQLRILPKLTSSVRKGGFTIAAEAGSDRLRSAIRKQITEQDMIDGVREAYRAGWRRVKVYFMAGLPGETDEDIDAIFDLCKKLSETGREAMGQPGAIAASVSWFVPKPHTPMQWAPMRSGEYFLSVRRRLRELSQRSAVQFRFHWVERSLLEGLLCRGDRRVGDVIETAWRNGASMDAWDEHFDFEKWTAAIAQIGIDLDACILEELPTDQLTPWSHIISPRNADFLADEYRKLQGALTGEMP